MKRLLYVVSITIAGLAGCKNSLVDRSLIFATNTSLGLEVAVNPSGTEAPAKILIGYKRAEGVLDPVYQNLDPDKMSAGSSHLASDYYLRDAYSVLAKFQGSASGSGGASSNVATTQPSGTAAAGNPGTLSADVQGGVTLSQWFATGEAAKILARYGGGALSDNPGVSAAVSAGAVAAERHYGATLSGVSAADSLVALVFAYKTLGAQKTDETAQADVAALDAMARSLIPDSYMVYMFDGPSKTLSRNKVDATKVPQGFLNLLDYRGSRAASIDSINLAFAAGPFTLSEIAPDGTSTVVAQNIVKTDLTGKTLQQESMTASKDFGLINDHLQRDPAVLNLFDYFVKAVTR